jgi:hypothetical protein
MTTGPMSSARRRQCGHELPPRLRRVLHCAFHLITRAGTASWQARWHAVSAPGARLALSIVWPAGAPRRVRIASTLARDVRDRSPARHAVADPIGSRHPLGIGQARDRPQRIKRGRPVPRRRPRLPRGPATPPAARPWAIRCGGPSRRARPRSSGPVHWAPNRAA